MKLLFDIFPVALFFAAYKFADIYVATGVAIVANVLQILWLRLTGKKVEPMMWISLAIIAVFGGATLYLHDETFIKWKPTVLYLAMAIGLAIALWAARKNFLKLMLGSQLELPDAVWMNLNKIWIGYCVFMAAANGYVAAYFSTDEWVNFKLWGYVFPLAFIIGQGLYIAPHLKNQGDEVQEPKP